MPDIFDTPEENKPDPVLEAINSLKEQITGFGGRLDSVEQRFNEEPEEEIEETPQAFVPKTWDDIPAKAEEIARNIVEESRQQQIEEQQAEEQARTEAQNAMDASINAQISELESSNIIPKVKNESDENDPGRIARRELFGVAARIGTIDLKAAAETIGILHKSGYTYDPRANNMKGEYLRSGTTPSGINSPVNTSSRSGVFNTNQPDYKVISNSQSLDDLIARVDPGLSGR